MKQFVFEAIGADPEVFFVTKDGAPQSVEGLLGGSKYDPAPIPGAKPGFFVQEDNVAAEYNIPPAKSAGEFSRNISEGLKYLKKVAAQSDLSLATVSAMHFPMEQLLTPHARKLGCEPDFNVWTGAMNPRPIAPPTLRTAAGHVHVSWKEPENEQRLLLGKYLDVRLALPSLLITEPTERRMLYGRAGCIRPKDYGLEYRVLGNEWLNEKRYREHVFEVTKNTLDHLNDPGLRTLLVDSLEELGDDIQDTINTHNIDNALMLMNYFDVSPFPFLRKYANQ